MKVKNKEYEGRKEIRRKGKLEGNRSGSLLSFHFSYKLVTLILSNLSFVVFLYEVGYIDTG